MPINVTRSSMPSFEEYCNEIKELWDSRWLTNMGAKHRQLEGELCKYLGCNQVMLYTNGHLALENAIAAYGFAPGSEVITTPFTFASTTHAIVRCGLTPVFADVREDDYTLDVVSAEKLITDKTVAILPVHVYGNLCDTEGLQALADKYSLKLIYDAAHAFGVYKDGVSAACFGDVSMFSFHATKVYNTIEGGALTYKDGGLTNKLTALRNFGMETGEDVPCVGGNAKMNEFQAAMGLCNLRHVDEEIAKRKAVVERYRSHLGSISGIRLAPVQPGVKSNYAYFPVVFDGFQKTRDEVFAQLGEAGIGARKYFYPLTNGFACYKDLPIAGEEKTPVASRIASRVLCLPLYADLALSDVDRICDIILE